MDPSTWRSPLPRTRSPVALEEREDVAPLERVEEPLAGLGERMLGSGTSSRAGEGSFSGG